MQMGSPPPPPPPPAARRNPRPPPAQRSVAWEARAPAARPDSGAGTLRVWECLQALWPDLYPSVTAAKKAVRRREIVVDGAPATPSSTLAGGELLQCVQREGGISHLAPAQGDEHGAAAAAAAVDTTPDGEAILPLEVVYEDEHMACVVKPPGVPVDTPPGRSSQGDGSGGGGGRQGDGSSSHQVSGRGQPKASTQGAEASGEASAGSEASLPKAPPPAAPSVYTRLARSLAPSRLLGALRRPRHCHRLDEPTGGLLLVGKTRQAQAAMCGAFQDRRVNKRYRALVWGRLEGRGRLTWELDNRHCDTEYLAVGHSTVDASCLGLGGSSTGDASSGASGSAEEGQAAAAGGMAEAGALAPAGQQVWVTTVDLWPHTGRKHQLRRHMALLGHPLVGDPRYTFGYAAARQAAGLPLPPEGHQLLPLAGPAEAAPGAAPLGGHALPPPQQCFTTAAAAAAGVAAPSGSLPAVAQAATAAHGLKLCLWAVELHLERHPATGEPMQFFFPEPAAFQKVRTRLAAGM
ncbi:hypothetical protein ABPG75_009279 [Micractinium tetrahymenae]